MKFNDPENQWTMTAPFTLLSIFLGFTNNPLWFTSAVFWGAMFFWWSFDYE